jgi:hypothetical protein
MALESSVLQKTAADEPSDLDFQCRIRAEFEEMPGLKLTLPQALRLFDNDCVSCQRALWQLVAAGVLGVEDGLFVLGQRRARSWRRRKSSERVATVGGRARRR